MEMLIDDTQAGRPTASARMQLRLTIQASHNQALFQIFQLIELGS